MAHRIGALLSLLYLAWLASRAWKQARLRNTAISLAGLLLVQAVLGVSAGLAELPLLLVTAHNGIAAMLLLAIVNLNHLVTPTAGRATSPAAT